jgi:hypothetical protein
MRSTLLGIAACVLTMTANGADERILPPTAVVQLPFRADWSVALEPPGGLLIAAESALYWTDLQDGKLTPPTLVTKTHSGPVWRESADGVGYAFDRYAVYAIELQAPRQPRLLWKIDDAEHFKPTEDDDPEFILRFRDVRPTPIGAVVIRSDGRFGLFGRDAGRLIWQREVANMLDARLLASGSTVALTQMQSTGLVCYLFQAQSEPPTLRPATLGNQRTRIDAMALRDHRLVVIRGSTIASLELGGSWIEAPLAAGVNPQHVASVGGRLCSIAPNAITLWRTTTDPSGLEIQRYLEYPSVEDWRDWCITTDRVWALRDPLDGAQCDMKRSPRHERTLATWSLTGDNARPDAVYRLREPGGVATATWSVDRLWLIADDRLYVYNLPSE